MTAAEGATGTASCALAEGGHGWLVPTLPVYAGDSVSVVRYKRGNMSPAYTANGLRPLVIIEVPRTAVLHIPGPREINLSKNTRRCVRLKIR